MMKAGMYSAGVNIFAKAKLLYTAQPLKVRMLQYIEHQRVWYSNKPVYRVVKYFALVHGGEEKGLFGKIRSFGN